MTDHFEGSTLSVMSVGALGESQGEKPYLVLFAGESATRIELPRTGELVLGRADTADLRINDPTVSRRHAKLMIADGELAIVDLESQHGTRVNGAPISGLTPLGSGHVIGLGDQVSLVVHAGAPALRPRGLLPLRDLKQKLAEELDRFQRFRRPVSVVALSGTEDLGVAASNALEGRLRMIDAAGWDGPLLLLLVLPEAGPPEAREQAMTLAESFARYGLLVGTGYACCPDDGVDPDALLSAARDAAALPGKGARAASEAQKTVIAGPHRILLADPAMVRTYELLERLAVAELPVLIQGETGSGKELAAAALHAWSRRSKGPFITLNCAALPENLVESELFGYEKGAFSGAEAAKPGLLEAASGGTFFLDELGELALSVQAKLLRALETRQVTRLGDVTQRPLDLRFVAATHRDLEAEVGQGRFRRDLFYRLNTARITLPPLRDRRRELPILARAFLDQAAERAGRPRMAISPEAMGAILSHRWPGNVRELRNAMEYAAATALGEQLHAWQLPESVQGAPEPGTPGTSGGAGAGPGGIGSPTEAAQKERKFLPIEEELKELERTRMIEALDAAKGVKTHAAQLISMPLRTFMAKLERYGVAPPQRPKR
jgi:DNA-binding NtrC family response regulator